MNGPVFIDPGNRLTLRERLIVAIAGIFQFLMVSIVVVSIGYTLWIGWALSSQLRLLLDHWAWSTVIYLMTVLSIVLLAMLVQRFWPRLILGGPVYGDLGGIPRRSFDATLRARPHIRVQLFDRDQEPVTRFNTIQNRMLHDMLKANYMHLRGVSGTPGPDIEAEWHKVWERDILDRPVDGETLREAASVDRFGFSYTMNVLVRSNNFMPVLTILFWAVIVVLVYLYANGSLDLITTVQIGLLLSLLLAGAWHGIVLHSLSEVPLTFQLGMPLPEPAASEFAADIQRLEGYRVRPRKVEIAPPFYAVFRNYQSRLLLSSAMADVLVMLFVIGAMQGMIGLLDSTFAQQAWEWHQAVLSGILAAAFTLAGSFYVFSLLMQHFRALLATLVASGLAVALPFVLEFVVGDGGETLKLREILIAAGSALSVALVTFVTSRVKSSLS